MSDDKLKYPIGKFAFPAPEIASQPAQRELWISEIAEAPAKLRAAAAGLSKAQLDTTVSSGRLDRTPGPAPCSGEPHERIYPVQARTY